jgi:hypothetical protein
MHGGEYMINFVKPRSTEYYSQIWDSFIEPIARFVDTFSISDSSRNDSLNVHLDNSHDYFEEVGVCGKNVYIPHGIADKNLRDASMLQLFDFVVVSGVYWKNKLIYEGMDLKKIFVGGYPKMDLVAKNIRVASTEILWCPTHSNTPGSTYPGLLPTISTLKDKYKVVVSEHPYNRESKLPTFSELSTAKVVIADCGSTLYEAWALGIPVVFADWLVKDKITTVLAGSFEAKIYNEGIGYHANSEEEFVDMIEKAYNEYYLDYKVKEFIDGIFAPSLVGKSGKRIAEFLNGR